MSWEVAIGLFHVAVTAVYGWLCYRLGWKRGNALTPNDHVLRDVARQRDAMMRERDEALAAANRAIGFVNSCEDELRMLRAKQAKQANGRLN